MDLHSEYKLSAEIFGHSSDVKAVTYSSSNNCLVSCSRDRSTKLWAPNKSKIGYVEVETLRGHKNYVASVCILTPTPSFPCGLVLTGGYDKQILGFEPQSTDPIIEHEAHEDAVCKLVRGNNENIFLSASFDKSVKCWAATRDGITCTTAYRGHSLAVWSVAILKRELIATASADKTINIYIADGPLLRKLEGHTDCVRDVTPCGDYEILSCSNDTSVKRWDVQTGQCLQTFFGHSNYVYSVSFFDGIVATASEDSCVTIWKKNGEKQTIELPSQTIWTCTILPNTDVVTGSSDGIIRVFTTDPNRMADPATLMNFEDRVNQRKNITKGEIGGVQISSLPGVEALREPGRSDGQTKMVREGEGAVCYCWSAIENTWNKVGEVVSGSGGTQQSSGKVLYRGKEYDFVFSVDVEEGKSPLKLPYNRADDPWAVAQAFILEYNLPHGYLDQVAKFIMTNAKTEENGFVSNTSYVDPFTGTSRYVPGSGAVATGNVSHPESSGGPLGGNRLFPLSNYITMEVCNLKHALEKLRQFNEEVDPMLKCNQNECSDVVKLGDKQALDFRPAEFGLLKQLLLRWPAEYHFPLVDVLRLAVRKEVYSAAVCSDNALLEYIIVNLANAPILNLVTLFRLICNMFSQPPGEQFIYDNRDTLLRAITNACKFIEQNKLLQFSVNAVLANLATLFLRRGDVDSQTVLLITAIDILPLVNKNQLAICNLLISIGTALTQCPDLKKCLEGDVINRLRQLTTHPSNEVQMYSKVILTLF